MTKTLKQGLFITLEGGEGVGKSTVLKELLKSLENTSVEVVTSREPGGTKGAEAIRSFVLKPPLEPGWDAMTQLLLFNAARADHLARKIRPALQRGAIVLCDRFSDSTRAYQSAAGGIDAEIVETIDQCVVGDDQPDLTLILDMPLEIAAKRRETRGGETDVFEKLGLGFSSEGEISIP